MQGPICGGAALGVMPVIPGSFPSFPDVVLNWC
jgi:hypothetical protein